MGKPRGEYEYSSAEDADALIDTLKKFLTKLDAKHNDKFKRKFATVKSASKLAVLLTAMAKHTGNAEDYLV